MGFYQWSTDGMGLRGELRYSVAKASTRKQVALLVHHPGVTDVAAYFRTVSAAVDFAHSFGLEVHGNDSCEEICMERCIGVCGV